MGTQPIVPTEQSNINLDGRSTNPYTHRLPDSQLTKFSDSLCLLAARAYRGTGDAQKAARLERADPDWQDRSEVHDVSRFDQFARMAARPREFEERLARQRHPARVLERVGTSVDR